jgi:hypothetical protein
MAYVFTLWENDVHPRCLIGASGRPRMALGTRGAICERSLARRARIRCLRWAAGLAKSSSPSQSVPFPNIALDSR